jgi:hypothetical protein
LFDDSSPYFQLRRGSIEVAGRRQLEKLSLGYQTYYILSTRIPEKYR